jgi:hypothetical protein
MSPDPAISRPTPETGAPTGPDPTDAAAAWAAARRAEDVAAVAREAAARAADELVAAQLRATTALSNARAADSRAAAAEASRDAARAELEAFRSTRAHRYATRWLRVEDKARAVKRAFRS